MTFNDILVQIGIVAASVIVILKFLPEQVFGHLFARALQSHKAALDQQVAEHRIRLEAQQSTQLERLRSTLAISARERSVVFSRLHARRAIVMAGLAKRIEMLRLRVEYFVNDIGVAQENNRPSWQEALNAYKNLDGFLNTQSIWIDLDTEIQVRELLFVLKDPITSLQIVEGRNVGDFRAEWLTAQEVVTRIAPEAIQQLKARLRAILSGAPEPLKTSLPQIPVPARERTVIGLASRWQAHSNPEPKALFAPPVCDDSIRQDATDCIEKELACWVYRGIVIQPLGSA